MKRYLVFAGDYFYPGGGWSDFVDSYKEVDDAIRVAVEEAKSDHRWAHIVDTEKDVMLEIGKKE